MKETALGWLELVALDKGRGILFSEIIVNLRNLDRQLTGRVV
jgi:hypothetical protein